MGTNPGNGGSMLSKRDELERSAQEQLQFLLTEKSYKQAATERKPMSTIYYRIAQDIGFQMTLEFRDESVELYLLQLDEGRVPRHGCIVESTAVRLPLIVVLRDIVRIDDVQIAAQDRLLRSGSLDFHQAEAALPGWRAILERYVDFLESQPLGVLFPPAEEVYRIMAPRLDLCSEVYWTAIRRLSVTAQFRHRRA